MTDEILTREEVERSWLKEDLLQLKPSHEALRAKCAALAARLAELEQTVRAKLADCRENGECSDPALLPGEFCSDECVALDAAISAPVAVPDAPKKDISCS